MLDFRHYRPDDFEACLALIREGHDSAFSPERFRWLHEQAPAGTSAIALCCEGAEVKGIYSVVRKTVRLGEHTYVGGRDVDPVVHPSCRGQGVFTRLLDFGLENFEGIDFFFNFANAASAAGFRRKGWRDVTTLDDRVFQLGWSRILSREFVLWVLTGMKNPRSASGEIREIETAEARDLLHTVGAEHEVWTSPGRLGVERSPSYMEWRFLNHPQHTYRWFVQRRPDGAFALAVCRHQEEMSRLLVLDAVGFGMKPDLSVWLKLWAAEFPNSVAVTWSTLPPNCRSHFVGNPLARGKGLTFLARPFPGRETPPELMQSSGWHLTHGDLEIS